MERHAVRLTIRGHVQGVGYRWWATQMARRLAIAGWVRNRSDGSVELLAIGPKAAIAELVETCRRGPSEADVEVVERADAQDDGSTGFHDRPTL